MSELPTSVNGNRAEPWGFWATIGFSSTLFAAAFIIQAAVVIVFVLVTKAHSPEIDIENFLKSLSKNGFCLTIATIASAPICTALIVLFIKLRKSFPIRNYLALRKPTRSELVRWLLFLGIFLVFSDVFTYILNRPIQDFMIDAYKTAYFAPAFYIALIIIAPIFEEISIRGFLFQGIRYSRLGSVGAVSLTALAWSAMHLQYDRYGMIIVLLAGVLLGVARLKSNSIYVTVAMHSLWNMVAIIEVAVYVKFFS